MQNVPENSAKSSLTWLHFKTDHGLRREENKVEFLEGRFLDEKKASLSPQKESWAFFWTFSFHFLSFNGVFLSLKCRTLVLKHRSAWWSLSSHFVENLPLRFPNMVKMNIHKHWTRVTRFNPLWVSEQIQWTLPWAFGIPHRGGYCSLVTQANHCSDFHIPKYSNAKAASTQWISVTYNL